MNDFPSVIISVIIPTHNRVDLLQRAIESVQNQTYKNIEIIIVSDGSTDNTNSYINEIKRKDDRISFYEYFPSKGANYARNLGIDKSKGEYIAFLDDDDEWLPTKLEKQLDVFLSCSDVGLVYTGKNIIYVNEKVKYSCLPILEGDLSKKIFIKNYIGSTSSVMLKKELLQKVGKFDPSLKAMQDRDLWIRICQITKIKYVKENLLNYYNYTNKKQISSVTQKYVDSINEIKKKYNCLYEKLDNNQIKLIDYMNNIALANRSLRNKDNKICREYCYKALRINFSFRAIILYILSYFDFKTSLKLRKLIDKL